MVSLASVCAFDVSIGRELMHKGCFRHNIFRIVRAVRVGAVQGRTMSWEVGASNHTSRKAVRHSWQWNVEECRSESEDIYWLETKCCYHRSRLWWCVIKSLTQVGVWGAVSITLIVFWTSFITLDSTVMNTDGNDSWLSTIWKVTWMLNDSWSMKFFSWHPISDNFNSRLVSKTNKDLKLFTN